MSKYLTNVIPLPLEEIQTGDKLDTLTAANRSVPEKTKYRFEGVSF